jgi:feruloyl esterase
VELLCKDADGPACLTKPQVESARAIYSSGSARGSENGWATMAGPNIFAIGNDFFKFVVFENPAWDYRTFNIEADMPRIRKAENGILNATDPHLEAFLRHGKLIQYHGWSDPQISPLGSVAYYKSALEAMGGPAKVQDGYRLFMIPGMAHCGGGDGASTFDMLDALEQWVQNGKAPVRIPASRIRNGQADRTRPLCPYPQLATYKGTGSPDDAANFTCTAP